jgi:putative ABC transport system permease protein
MPFVALKMLFGDRAKYLMLLCGLSFAVMLIVQQGSIFWGLMIWSQSGISNVNVEIWVTDPNISQVEEIKPVADTTVDRVRTVHGVDWAVPLYKGVLRARLSNGEYHRISVVGLDAATLLGRPGRLFEGRFDELRTPDAVVVDQWAVERMGGPDVIKVGTVFEINDKKRASWRSPTPRKTFRIFRPSTRRLSEPWHTPLNEESCLTFWPGEGRCVHRRTDPAHSRETGLGAFTAEEFGLKTIMWVLKNTGIGINFGTTIVLGFIVGMAIAGQTFYLFTVENLKQFGALKAMGASTFALSRMIILQAFTVGAIGYGVGIGLATLFGRLTASEGSCLSWKPGPAGSGFGALLGICSLSALISIVKLAKLEPAIVFRG